MKSIAKTGKVRWGGKRVAYAGSGSAVFRVEAPGLITADGASFWLSPERKDPTNPGRAGGGRAVLYPDAASNMKDYPPAWDQ